MNQKVKLDGSRRRVVHELSQSANALQDEVAIYEAASEEAAALRRSGPSLCDLCYLDVVGYPLREESSEEIRHLAYHDELTGLPTLRLGKDRLSNAIALARRSKNRIAVLFLDLEIYRLNSLDKLHETKLPFGGYLTPGLAQKLEH